MNIIKTILIAIIAFAAFIAITGFLFLPPVLKHVLTKQISGVLHRETSINQITINPFALSASIKGLKLADPGQNTPFVAFNELYVNADVMTSVFRRALISRRYVLTNLTLAPRATRTGPIISPT